MEPFRPWELCYNCHPLFSCAPHFALLSTFNCLLYAYVGSLRKQFSMYMGRRVTGTNDDERFFRAISDDNSVIRVGFAIVLAAKAPHAFGITLMPFSFCSPR